MPDKDEKQQMGQGKDEELHAAPLETAAEEFETEDLEGVEGGAGIIRRTGKQDIQGPRRLSGVSNDTLFGGAHEINDLPIKK